MYQLSLLVKGHTLLYDTYENILQVLIVTILKLVQGSLFNDFPVMKYTYPGAEPLSDLEDVG